MLNRGGTLNSGTLNSGQVTRMLVSDWLSVMPRILVSDCNWLSVMTRISAYLCPAIVLTKCITSLSKADTRNRFSTIGCDSHYCTHYKQQGRHEGPDGAYNVSIK